MNEETGQVILLRKLDREMHDLLILDVLVKDNGSPSLNDSAQVTIFLADENDNSPVIHPSTIETKVKEVNVWLEDLISCYKNEFFKCRKI